MRAPGAAAAGVVGLVALVGCAGSASGASRDGGRAATIDAHAIDGRASDAGDADDRAEPGRDAGHPADAASDALAATTLSLSLPLVPAFSPSTHDYYVRCTAGTNAIVVSMSAAPGATVALTQPVATSPAAEATIPLTVAAGAAIVASVTTGDATEEYWVRCLPPDFPEMEMALHPDAGTPTPGYYLVGTIGESTGAPTYAMALDGNGVPVWYLDTTAVGSAFDVDNLVPGTISFSPLKVSSAGTTAKAKFDLDDLLTGSTSYVESVGEPLDAHELRVLPDGDYLVLSSPLATGVDLTGLAGFGADETAIDCIVQEVSPGGAAVWQWDAMDHFDPATDSTYPTATRAGTVTAIDVFHCNSIDVDGDGNLLVSARNMDSIFLVSKTTGAVLWKMGGATYTKDSAVYVTVEGDPDTSFYRQHDARFLADGTLSMFDDQTDKPGPARAVIYSYDLTSATASVVWQYDSGSTSEDLGSFRLLADGSRVIGWGYPVTASLTSPAFSEVTLAGQSLLDFTFPGDWSYRAIKVPTTAFDIAVLRATAGTGAP